jgi:hypothetical protein
MGHGDLPRAVTIGVVSRRCEGEHEELAPAFRDPLDHIQAPDSIRRIRGRNGGRGVREALRVPLGLVNRVGARDALQAAAIAAGALRFIGSSRRSRRCCRI